MKLNSVFISSIRTIFFFASFALLSNCAVGPNYKKPNPTVPDNYTSSGLGKKTIAVKTRTGKSQSFVKGQTIPAQWWELFHSKPLNELVIASLRYNPNVDAAKAALKTSLENVYAQKGVLFPYIGAGFTPSWQQTAGILQSNLASNRYNYALYTGQVFVAYTLDLFGGNRRQLESLIAQAEFQRLELEATYLTLSTNVVNAAIQEASLREQIVATKEIIKSQAHIVTIYKKQIGMGNVAEADLATQEAALAASEASLPPLEQQLALQRDLLNALAGRFPDDVNTPRFNLDSIELPGELPLSLPSTLLEHRPDIRAAEEQMHAANALIGVAVANRLPNVTIGFTNLGTAALELSTLFGPKTPFWGMAGIITQPIFSGGTLLHKQRAAQAAYVQAAAQYRLTVINAFQNVADTLKSIKLDATALQAAKKAEQATSKSLIISRRQLGLGDNSLLLILINEQNHQQARLNLIRAEANRLSDTAALFQALGGGWWNKSCV